MPPGDLESLAAALRTVVADSEWRAATAGRSAALGREFTWDRVARPLAEFCAAPTRSPDLIADDVDRLQLGLTGPTGGSLVTRLRAAWREGGPRLLVQRARHRLVPRPRRVPHGR